MTFEIGQRVRVLPGARSVDNYPEDEFYFEVAGDKTVIIEGIREDGDLAVRDSDGMLWYFAAEFLEALEETPDPTPEVKVGDKVRTSVIVTGVVSHIDLTGDFYIDLVPGHHIVASRSVKVQLLERAHVAPKVGDFVDPQGKYAPGTVAILDTRTDYVVVKEDEDNSWAGSGVGARNTRDFLPDRWKIIYIPEEAK